MIREKKISSHTEANKPNLQIGFVTVNFDHDFAAVAENAMNF